MKKIKKIIKRRDHLILVKWNNGSTAWEDVDLIWDYIPFSYRPGLDWERRCEEHWNTSDVGDQLDGPPPRKLNCRLCKKEASQKICYPDWSWYAKLSQRFVKDNDPVILKR